MEMRKLNYIIILVAILLFAFNFIEGECSTRIYRGNGFESCPLEHKKQWAEYMQKSCSKELAEMKKELGDCILYLSLKTGEINIGSSIILSKQRPHGTLTSLQSNLQELVLGCIRKNHHLFRGLSEQDGCTRNAKLHSHQYRFPRRYLAEKSSKVASSTAASPTPDVFDDPIIIPPDLLYPSPPPMKVEVPVATSGREEHNKKLNKVITIAASIAGTVVIFALVLFCCLMRGHSWVADGQKDDRPLLTLSSGDYSAGSSMSSDIKDGGRNTSFNNSNLKQEGFGGPLAEIPENGSTNTEGLSYQKLTPEKASPPAPAPPPPPPPKPKPQPPPPPKGVKPPPAPPKVGGKGPPSRGRSDSGDGSDPTNDPDAPRTKLKPFFWDKVVGNPEQSMVWDEIRSGSFQFNEEMIESLFGYNPDNKRNAGSRNQSNDASQPQYIQIIDPKKSQNLSILLKALNVTTEEVRDALLEGNELPTELLQTLLRMAPTQEEELKLRIFSGDTSQLGPAERFLKVMVDIPFAFKRMDSLMFMMTFKEEVSSIKESFATLEVACDDLKKSRLFLKLLEAVLKTGNRMNDGTYRGGAQAFKLDTLLKLADVKGTDGKTTLLHFVVQEIIRSEGLKALRAAKDNRSVSSMKTDDSVEDPTFDPSEQYQTLGLQVVSGISSELENIKKAAIIDNDVLTSTVSKLGQSIKKNKNFLNNEMGSPEEETGFYQALVSFVEHSEGEVTWLQEEEKRISDLVRKTADYFHGNAGREEGLRLFSIVRDFLLMLDKICTELRQSFARLSRNSSKESSLKRPALEQHQSIQDMRQKLFPAIADRRVDSSSDSDDD
ncbi:formin-like protein 3 isoform X1 [Chenopodium quinoa]|nr:formin-like protein 3 isoform X1 [Chenopodium quinoa]XP_021730827.1 formin-like protein 3 isoform X1 [Chenopodium quinoa]XP_021730828.1 formin-like protein 3 isoform X1 [Chenopodium quinoa]